ncbi:MAG: hypothetical protein OEZ58_13790 [Gammaproteobacteria bacterium]|nr:hypothetical protein [Gammaproteobacteria bacterium]MDH5730061.1 hypothetical protein [Gammaproteobacteria bacterium]
MKLIITTLMLLSILFSSSYASDIKDMSTSNNVTLEEFGLSVFYGGIFYYLGRGSAKIAAGVQSTMLVLSLFPSSKNDPDLAVFQYSLLGIASLNYLYFSKYDNKDSTNRKSANFNALSMTLWALGASYFEKRTEQKEGKKGFKPLVKLSDNKMSIELGAVKYF